MLLKESEKKKEFVHRRLSKHVPGVVGASSFSSVVKKKKKRKKGREDTRWLNAERKRRGRGDIEIQFLFHIILHGRVKGNAMQTLKKNKIAERKKKDPFRAPILISIYREKEGDREGQL